MPLRNVSVYDVLRVLRLLRDILLAHSSSTSAISAAMSLAYPLALASSTLGVHMSTDTTEIRNVVVIGSGPAGWTAALYTGRANLRPLVFEGSAPNLPGGQLMITSEVENFPGFPHGVLGPELMEKFKEQATRFQCDVISENVVRVDFSQRPFIVESESGMIVKARTVIISTGANAKLLGIPQEKELMSSGAGVSACATCDGAFYKGARVAVIGGGDTAMEEALFLTRFASEVMLIHRRDQFRASRIMVERARNHPKIKLITNSIVDEILTVVKPPFGRKALTGLRLRDTVTGELSTVDCEGMFVAIGHQPNTKLFEGQLPLDEQGYLQTIGKGARTNVEGVFACGDVQDSYYRQAITAAGSGCMAAIDAERFLESEGH